MQTTLSPTLTKSSKTTWLSCLLIAASILFGACLGGSSALGRQYQADTLFLLPLVMETVPHVYFQDDDGINKVILPSTTGNELLVLHTQLGNYAAESTVLDIESEPAEIRTEDGTSFLSLNTLRKATPSTITLKTIVDNVKDDSREISLKEAIKIKNDPVIGDIIETDSYTDKDKFIPFLRGRQEVLRNYHLDGWLVFDVPIDSKFSLLRWEISGDVIRIDL